MFGPQLTEARQHSSKQGAIMKKLFATVVLTGCLAVFSFAGDVAGQSVKAAGKDSAKAATQTAKYTANAAAAAGKFFF